MNSTKGAIQFEITVSPEDLARKLKEVYQAILDSGKTAAETVAQTIVSPAEEATLNQLEEIKAQWGEWVDDYQQIEDQITAVKNKAKADRAKIASTIGDEDKAQAATLVVDRGEASKIQKLKIDQSKLTESWEALFPDLTSLSRIGVNKLIDDINKQLENKDLSVPNVAALQKQLEKIQKASTYKLFGDLGPSMRAVREAKKELEEAQKASEGRSAGDKTEEPESKKTKSKRNKRKDDEPTEEVTAAEIKLADAKKRRTEATSAHIKDISGIASVTSDLLKNFGIESPAVDGVVKSLSALGEINFANPISIITGGLKAVGALLGGIFGQMDAAKEKQIVRLQKDVDGLQKTYDALGKTIEVSYSTDKSDFLGESNEKLTEQNNLIMQQRQFEESKKKTDKGKIAEYDKAIEENNKRIEANKIAALDALFGEDLKSAIENFATAYADAWSKGEDRSKSARDTVRNMMRQMVTESIKAAIQSSTAMEEIRKKLEEFYADKVLTSLEQDYIYGMASDLQKELDSQFGWADSLMKDENTDGDRAASQRGIATASQESVDENNGLLTAMQGMLFDVKNNQVQMLDIQRLHLPNLQYLSQLSHLSTISENTAYCRRLEGIENDMSVVRGELQTMNLKGLIIRK